MGVEQKRGDKKTLKRGGKLGQGVGALKRGGADWNSLRTRLNIVTGLISSA